MPIFIVETAAISPIREYWRVEAATAEEAAETYGDKGQCLYDEVLGEEDGRQVSEVHTEAALASFFAAEAARKEAPAMLALLRSIGRDDDGDGMLDAAGIDRIAAILARIDGETVCASCGAPEGESHGQKCEARAFDVGASIRRAES